MSGGDNSSKRDRLQIEDIEHLIEIEKRTGISAMSWQTKSIWEYIKNNYKSNLELVPTVYRNLLKQNMANYMFILKTILTSCPNSGEKFLVENFLKPNYRYFEKTYEFNTNGEIIHEEPRHYTERNMNETERYRRIAINSVLEYSEKYNRNTKSDLSCEEYSELLSICHSIENNEDTANNKLRIVSLVESIEQRLINQIL